jgi:hypothetical protein
LDALLRKNNLLHEEFRGKNKPRYIKKDGLAKMMEQSNLPSIHGKKKDRSPKNSRRTTAIDLVYLETERSEAKLPVFKKQ